MLENILGGVGLAALVIGLGLLGKALVFMKSGEKVLAEVISCVRSQKGWYSPKVRHNASGKEVEAVSAVEFANEIKSGEQRLIIYNKPTRGHTERRRNDECPKTEQSIFAI